MKSKIAIALCCVCCAMFLSTCSEGGESQESTAYLTRYFDYFEVESISYYIKVPPADQPEANYVTAQDPADVDRILRYFMSFPRDISSHGRFIGGGSRVVIKGVNGERAFIYVQGNDISETITDADGVIMKDADGRDLDGSVWYQGDDWDNVHVIWDIHELFGFERPETE